MEGIGDLGAAEKKVLADVEALISEVRSIVAGSPPSAAVALLSQLQDICCEDLNHIQHEYLILAAAAWLIDQQRIVPSDTEWHWNPRQTGGADEPDLCGKRNGKTLVCAEITTSRRPIGTILDRMRVTLAKLNGFEGKKYYFVRTESMSTKAKAIVSAERQNIENRVSTACDSCALILTLCSSGPCRGSHLARNEVEKRVTPMAIRAINSKETPGQVSEAA